MRGCSTFPRVTVVIPCYNRSGYLEEAVDSVLEQQGPFELVEVLLVDDRSDDPATLHTYHCLSKRELVRVLANSGPRGAAAARNTGIRAAKGDWIAFLDSDDVWLEGSLAIRGDIATSESGCEWISGDMCNCYEDGHQDSVPRLASRYRLSCIFQGRRQDDRVSLQRPVKQFLRSNIAWTSTTMLKRELLLRVGGFDECLVTGEDYHLWLRLAQVADLCFVLKPLALYRQHEGNIMKTGNGRTTRLRVYETLLKDPQFQGFRQLIRAGIAECYLKQGRHFRMQAQFLRAFQAFARSLAYSPSDRRAWFGLAASTLRRH